MIEYLKILGLSIDIEETFVGQLVFVGQLFAVFFLVRCFIWRSFWSYE